jgi:hypothetical protein
MIWFLPGLETDDDLLTGRIWDGDGALQHKFVRCDKFSHLSFLIN